RVVRHAHRTSILEAHFRASAVGGVQPHPFSHRHVQHSMGELAALSASVDLRVAVDVAEVNDSNMRLCHGKQREEYAASQSDHRCCNPTRRHGVSSSEHLESPIL